MSTYTPTKAEQKVGMCIRYSITHPFVIIAIGCSCKSCKQKKVNRIALKLISPDKH